MSMPQGGMLTPSSLLSEIAYSGIMSPSGTDTKGLSVELGVPFNYGWFGSWYNGWRPNLTFSVEYIETGQIKWPFIKKIVWNLEQIFLTSVRIHFFPMLGLFFMCFGLKKITGQYILRERRFKLERIGFYGAALFLTGFIFCFFFSMNGYKWELSRFLIPGVTIGMLGISLVATNIKFQPESSRKISVYFILLFNVFGPVVDFVGTSARNVFNLLNNDVFLSYFLDLFGPGPVLN
jgi:hypothetical protein